MTRRCGNGEWRFGVLQEEISPGAAPVILVRLPAAGARLAGVLWTASITGYRDKSFSSPCTGTVAPVHHTPWWEELDDSMATFLNDQT